MARIGDVLEGVDSGLVESRYSLYKKEIRREERRDRLASVGSSTTDV